MSRMTEQSAAGGRTPEQHRQLSQRMESMSTMMHHMSDLESKPTMKGPEIQKQMDQMRKQIGEMSRSPTLKAPTKWRFDAANIPEN